MTRPAPDNDNWIEWPAEPMPIELAALLLSMETMPGPLDIDDCTEVYGDDVDLFAIIDRLDDDNTCSDPGDHLWLTDRATGETQCVHCRVPAMPVYATREDL